MRPASMRTGSTVSSPIGTAPALPSASHSVRGAVGLGHQLEAQLAGEPVRISQLGTPPTSTRSGRKRK